MERPQHAQATPDTATAVPVAPAAQPIDPQFVELFIEEAKEEITSIQSSFPLWIRIRWIWNRWL